MSSILIGSPFFNDLAAHPGRIRCYGSITKVCRGLKSGGAVPRRTAASELDQSLTIRCDRQLSHPFVGFCGRLLSHFLETVADRSSQSPQVERSPCFDEC